MAILTPIYLIVFSYFTASADSLNNPIIRKTIVEQGIASWYGDEFHGKPTANGELYNQMKYTAAHRTLPFGTELIVENMSNGKYVIVRINDRGPFAKDRIIDLSRAAAEKIDMIRNGTAMVRLRLAMGDSSVIDVSDIKNAHYAIQLGAYKDLSQANSNSETIDGCYVVMSFVDDQPIYRVYYGYFSDKQLAVATLSQLASKGVKGIVRQLEND